MNNVQPTPKDKPKDPLSALSVDNFHVRLGGGLSGTLIHQPQLLGRVSNPSANGQG